MSTHITLRQFRYFIAVAESGVRSREDLQTLQARHGTRHFYFIMDDLPPLMARQIPDAFAAAGIEKARLGPSLRALKPLAAVVKAGRPGPAKT